VASRRELEELRVRPDCLALRGGRREHADDLTIDFVVGRLVDDLRDRGRIDGDVPGNPDLGLLIIDEYIRFPAPA